jgi:hypothetical protein
MGGNAIQFQKGLSVPEFHKLYGTEALCEAALVKMRWPNGFRCPTLRRVSLWAGVQPKTEALSVSALWSPGQHDVRNDHGSHQAAAYRLVPCLPSNWTDKNQNIITVAQPATWRGLQNSIDAP